jgi:TrmH family RNA methyltransferase
MISSTQNDKVKLVYGLQTRTRTRLKERKVVLEGVRLIRDTIARGFKPLFMFYEPKSVDYEFLAELQEHDFPMLEVNEEVLAYMSDTQQPQGILGVFPMPSPEMPRKPNRVLILDGVSEPGNMGTILRSATASGVDLVILAPHCVDPYNPKVVRSGMGAHFSIPLVQAQWYEISPYCEGMKVYAAAGSGELRYDQADYTQRHAIIIGGEARGIGDNARELADALVYIPMAGGMESLNAAIASSVILFEATRQNSPLELPDSE